MGKYNHICELTGAENYPQWKRQITLALRGERLWPHCCSGSDPTNLADLASIIPVPVDSKKMTQAETEKILDWFAKDAQAKAIINRKVAPVVASQLDENSMARDQWNILAERYSRNDLLSQYELRAQVCSEKLKDADDAARYLRIFEDARRRFVQMGITYSDDEAVFDLLQGLPEAIEWQIFREITMMKLSAPTTPSTTSPPSKLLFDDVAKSFSEKANAIVGKRKLARPGSEYTNAVVASSGSTPTPSISAKINPITGLKMHRNNPDGVRCTNPVCAPLPCAENHNHDHCYWSGGGMEDKVPAWIRNKSKPKTETATVATVTTPAVVSAPEITNSATEHVGSHDHRRELSCASIVESSGSSLPRLAALLDSGTTSRIIVDRSCFIDFTPEDHPPVQTANQGELVTFG